MKIWRLSYVAVHIAEGGNKGGVQVGREPLRAAFLALFPEKEAWLKAERRVLMGRDLLKLGLKPGPKVGEILRRVAEARRRGEVRSFEEELALARKLLGDGTLALPE